MGSKFGWSTSRRTAGAIVSLVGAALLLQGCLGMWHRRGRMQRARAARRPVLCIEQDRRYSPGALQCMQGKLFRCDAKGSWEETGPCPTP